MRQWKKRNESRADIIAGGQECPSVLLLWGFPSLIDLIDALQDIANWYLHNRQDAITLPSGDRNAGERHPEVRSGIFEKDT